MNLKDNSLKKVEAVVEKLIPEQNITVKARLNNKWDAALLFKRALWGFENLVTLSAGLGVNNLCDKRTVHHGYQLEFNI